MKKIFALILILLVFQSCQGNSSKVEQLAIKQVLGNLTYSKVPETQKVDHKDWHELLQKHVDEQGYVNYKGFKNDQEQLINYLNYLSKSIPNESWTVNEQLAYFINLYNAATVKLIIDNYPIESIKNISKPWGLSIIKIGNDRFSLGDIEHTILRKMNEPRIHFAINCASFSCPNLLNEAYTAPTIEEQLERVSYSFINGDKNDISQTNPKLSKIFKWFKNDFLFEGEKNLIRFINQYSDIAIDEDADIDFIEYNWDLNEKN